MENIHKKLGVVVGRFQTPYLTTGHKHLIDTASTESDDTLIIVGAHEGWASGNDPLDTHTRIAMLKQSYPSHTVLTLKDYSSDETWSHELDALVKNHFPDHVATLFGSRESFIPFYKGTLATKEVAALSDVSATNLRKEVLENLPHTDDFRTGIIYAHTKQNYPTSFQAVDMAIMHSTENKVLLGRKIGIDGWVFVGGFVDPTDESLERAAYREVKEEVGDIELAGIAYIGSFRIDDHRYRKSVHKLMTALFHATYIFGPIKAHDDLAEVAWHDVDTIVEILADRHKALGHALLKHLGK